LRLTEGANALVADGPVHDIGAGNGTRPAPLVVVLLSLGPRLELGPARYSGVVPLLVGLVMILCCFADFVHHRYGTPAIYDPRREVVAAGLCRYVGNPQYVGVVLIIVGEAQLTKMVILFGYAGLMAIG
jgi:protein-S-isoprenylcysteine O-methyltransferase Ste14